MTKPALFSLLIGISCEFLTQGFCLLVFVSGVGEWGVG